MPEEYLLPGARKRRRQITPPEEIRSEDGRRFVTAEQTALAVASDEDSSFELWSIFGKPYDHSLGLTGPFPSSYSSFGNTGHALWLRLWSRASSCSTHISVPYETPLKTSLQLSPRAIFRGRRIHILICADIYNSLCIWLHSLRDVSGKVFLVTVYAGLDLEYIVQFC